MVSLMLGMFEFHPEFEYFNLQNLRPLARNLFQLDKDKRSLEAIVSGFYQFHSHEQGKGALRWGDKTPMHVYHLNEIYSVYPKAKFVYLLRDGIDVVYSYVGTHKENYDINRAADRWKSSLLAFEKFEHRTNADCYTVRYEELVERPVDVVSALLKYLDLEGDLARLGETNLVGSMGDVTRLKHHENVYLPIQKTMIGKGRRKFNKNELLLLQSLIGKELIANQYPHAE